MTTVAPRAVAVSSTAPVSEAASAVTRTRGPSTAVRRSTAVVAASPVFSVSVWTRITDGAVAPWVLDLVTAIGGEDELRISDCSRPPLASSTY